MNKIIYFLILLAITSNVANCQLSDSVYNCTFNIYESYSLGGAKKFLPDPTYPERYNFCKVGTTLMCNSKNNILNRITFIQDSSKLLKSSDFYCLPNLKFITIDNFNLDQNFLLGNFNNGQSLSVVLNNGNTSSAVNFDRFNSEDNRTNAINIYSLSISSKLSKSETVYLSNYRNITNLNLLIQPFLEFQTVLVNDLNKDAIKGVNWKFYTSNIPQLNISISELSFSFYPNFNKSSFSSFSTIGDVGTIKLDSLDRSVHYPFPSDLSNTTKAIIKIQYSIESPKSEIDLSKLMYLSSITFIGIGNNFKLNKSFPISNFSNSLYEFYYQDSGLVQLPNFEIFGSNIGIIRITNNSIGSKVPKSLNFDKYPLLEELHLTGNQLKGEIDSSWCNFKFYINDNFIEGEAPSCVTCHYYSSNDRISGNKFTNLASIPPCTSIIINLSFNSTTNEYRLWGKDLGWDPSYFQLINDTSVIVKNIIPNKEFIFSLSSTTNISDRSKRFTFKFPYTSATPALELEAAVYNDFSPLINNILKYGNIFIINGSYFSYDRDYVSVNISNFECYVLSCNFTTIQCIVINGIDDSDTESTIKGSVKIMDTPSNFSFARTEICGYDGGLCPVPDCSGKGNLNTSTGKCDCFTDGNWFGLSCEILKLQCKNNCSKEGGECDYIKTGKCICKPDISFVNYDDCSGRPCIGGCINGGICNTTNGSCDCIETAWTGKRCSTPNHSISNYSFTTCEKNSNKLLVTIYGWFGELHIESEITIGGSKCDIRSRLSNEIRCVLNYNDTTDPQILTVTQNKITKIWEGRFYFKNINDGNNSSDLEVTSSKEQENSDPNRIKKIILISIIPIAAVCLVIGTIILVVKIKVNSGMIPLKNTTL